MKKVLACMLILAMCMTGLSAAENAEQPKLQQDVLVLFTSDVHCGVDQGFGYVGLKAVKDTAEAAGSHALLVDDGDSDDRAPSCRRSCHPMTA